MTAPTLQITHDPGIVWRVGYEPDPWEWTPWRYATAHGLFDGRWDDPRGEFRSLYTTDSLLGCFLELLAHFRPHDVLLSELDDIEDDGTISAFPEAAPGEVGYEWLTGRIYGSAHQRGRYCFITHSRTIATLAPQFPFPVYGIAPDQVDAALLKDASARVLTQAIARWMYDLPGEDRRDLVDGVEFRSRHGDDIRVWAVFERADDDVHTSHLTSFSDTERVAADTPDLLDAFSRLGLRWHDV
ncbi:MULTISPECIES: hypothetical protein [unclassified Microbacterium]|uniref:hypothetical protein n=1 Tax=unclassified Microbacterium TaxID=2609290 RepID=UPI000C2BCD3A|nr:MULTISPECIES: hypothetical protein [unclassified Microbacterium]